MSKRNLKARCVDWCVSWWADGDAPSWLRRRMSQRVKLTQSGLDTDALENRLRRDALSWAACEEAAADSHSRLMTRETRSTRAERAKQQSSFGQLQRAVGFTVAVSIAVLLALYWIVPRTDVDTTASATTVIEERLEDEVQSIATVVGDSWERSEASFADISSSVAQSVRSASRPSLADAVAKPVRSFSRAYGQAVSFVAVHLQDLEASTRTD